MSNTYLICESSSTLTVLDADNRWNHCSGGWLQPTNAELADLLTLDIEASSPAVIAEVLKSISDFDPAVVSQFIGYYLAVFIIGFSVGSLVRYMKKT